MTLQGKDFTKLGEDEWEIMRAATFDSIKRGNPDWDDNEIDEFIVENFMELVPKLPIVMGWVTEEEMKEVGKKKAQPSQQE